MVEKDQHFMYDDEILDKIISSSFLSDSDSVLEIGPGRAFLTRKILEEGVSSLTSLELDAQFEHYLNSLKKEFLNFDYHIINALDIISGLQFDKLIANIPYSITEPLYQRMMDLKVPFAMLMQGEKFFNLINDGNSKWHHLINAFYDIELIETVPGEKFEPKTKVTSVILRLKLKENPSEKDLFFQKLFEKRKRNVKNALVYALVDSYGLSKKEAREKVGEISMEKRVENLSNEEFLSLIDKY